MREGGSLPGTERTRHLTDLWVPPDCACLSEEATAAVVQAEQTPDSPALWLLLRENKQDAGEGVRGGQVGQEQNMTGCMHHYQH